MHLIEIYNQNLNKDQYLQLNNHYLQLIKTITRDYRNVNFLVFQCVLKLFMQKTRI